MKINNQIHIHICLAFILIVSTPWIAVAYDALLESGRKAAIKELKAYPADNSRVGVGFRVFTIDTEKSLHEPPPQDYQSVVIPTFKYIYLVTNESKTRSILEMFFVDNRWSRGASGTGFAQALLNIMKAWPSSAGFHYRYIDGRHLHEDLIEISRKGKVIGIIRLLPSLVESDKAFTSGDLDDPNIFFKELLPRIRREIELHKRMNRADQ